MADQIAFHLHSTSTAFDCLYAAILFGEVVFLVITFPNYETSIFASFASCIF
jgi:hypothetical protein